MQIIRWANFTVLWKTPFLSKEETWTLPNAKLNIEHEPWKTEVELFTYITYRLQSNWNTRKENWYKLKEMYRRWKHKCQLQVRL